MITMIKRHEVQVLRGAKGADLPSVEVLLHTLTLPGFVAHHRAAAEQSERAGSSFTEFSGISASSSSRNVAGGKSSGTSSSPGYSPRRRSPPSISSGCR
jgi:hypothetical protein